MTLVSRSLLIPLGVSAVFILAPPAGGGGDAWAQIGPNQLPQPGSTTGGPSNKPAGVAEQAKEGVDRLPNVPVLPQDKNERKRFELFELNGNYRFRYDWFKKLHLGFVDRADGGAPFPLPISCYLSPDELFESGAADSPCKDNITTANMRLRLEPVINVTETAHIHMQVDVLDNVVLGSSPDNIGGVAPLNAFSDVQAPPLRDRNGLDAIRVRRLWAEIDTPLGHITFGRQPWHFGLGIFANAGGADPFSGGYDLDSDFGDTVDRVMLRAGIPGTNLQAAVATDWNSTYPVASQSSIYANDHANQPWDLGDADDVNQWVFMVTRFDKPALFRKNLKEEGSAFNYGFMLAYRTQDWETVEPDPEAEADAVQGREFSSLVYRGLSTYTPDVWVRYARKQLTLEFEGVATIGSIQNVSDIELPCYPACTDDPSGLDPAVEDPVTIFRLGAVGRVSYLLNSGKGKFGFEVGYASGDQWDNTPSGATHIRNARPLPISINDTAIQNFVFDPDYSVDLILFRELLGAVTNATYFKPNFTYEITSEIKARGAGILSLANRPVATPGNGGAYGLELNADVSYSFGGFSAGLAYGVLFPMEALNHRPDSGLDDGPGFDFGADNLGDEGAGDAATAQTIQARFIMSF